jgi:AcrR family transcriptional regulator
MILEVTGELLKEVGVERLSTNLICKRANISPPAIYRYFPNKYAILTELGRRLMEAEDRVVMEWLEENPNDIGGRFDQAVDHRMELMRRVRQVGQNSPGGAWILRAMRAVPVLEEVRQHSIERVAEAITQQMVAEYPDVDAQRLATATRLTTSLTSLANEMINDNPALEAGITHEMARMTTLYYRDLLFAKDENDLPTKQ